MSTISRLARRSRRRRAFTLMEVCLVVGIIGILISLSAVGWMRVQRQRQATNARQLLSSLDAAKLEWRQARGDADPLSTVPPEGEIAPLVTLDGRRGVGSLAELSAPCGGRVFFINALSEPASCSPGVDF